VARVTEPAGALAPRGARIGLPPEGRGSLAGFGHRLAAVALDWLACILVTTVLVGSRWAYGSTGHSVVTLGVFALEVFVLTWLGGASFGQRLVGLAVVPLGGRQMTAWRALVRTVLLCLVVPALVWDRDGRGLHDRAVDTAVVRAR
jgi:uncharacterized RDD family membrane protein YckC